MELLKLGGRNLNTQNLTYVHFPTPLSEKGMFIGKVHDCIFTDDSIEFLQWPIEFLTLVTDLFFSNDSLTLHNRIVEQSLHNTLRFCGEFLL